jgi:hypothetical protein
MMTVFAISTSIAQAATWTANSCGDAGGASGQGDPSTRTGDLRFATYFANSGDTVDVTCSRVTLTQGSLYLTQTNLTIKGLASIQQSAQDRVINHIGTGTLTLNEIVVVDGYYQSTTGAYGGCIYSKGNVALDTAGAVGCRAVSNGGNARGGGIFTKGKLTISHGYIANNEAIAFNHSGVDARGGGAFVEGDFQANYSAVYENAVGISGTTGGRGGGLHLGGNVAINSSLISQNYAGDMAGGVTITSSSPSALIANISNSTISGNSSEYIAGLYVNSGNVTIADSTIAFNTAVKGKIGSESYSAGVVADSKVAAMMVTLRSSLIANNTYGGAPGNPSDFSVAHTSSHNIAFNGAPANNLIFSTSAPVPSDTIQSVCPFLGPLRDNGGLTHTHALMSGSPALARGNSSGGFSFDQRGAGFPRISNGETAPDIGAYEMQRDDVIFATSFEACP